MNTNRKETIAALLKAADALKALAALLEEEAEAEEAAVDEDYNLFDDSCEW